MSSGACNHKEYIAFINTDKQHIKKLNCLPLKSYVWSQQIYSAA